MKCEGSKQSTCEWPLHLDLGLGNRRRFDGCSQTLGLEVQEPHQGSSAPGKAMWSPDAKRMSTQLLGCAPEGDGPEDRGAWNASLSDEASLRFCGYGVYSLLTVEGPPHLKQHIGLQSHSARERYPRIPEKGKWLACPSVGPLGLRVVSFHLGVESASS